jgi:hypothetical protein
VVGLQRVQIGDAAQLAGRVELAPPEARGRASVGDERAQALVLQRGQLVAREAPDGRVVELVLGKRHCDGAPARAPMPNTRSAFPA